MSRWTVDEVKGIDERRKARKAAVESFEFQPPNGGSEETPAEPPKRRGRPPKVRSERNGEVIPLDEQGRVILDVQPPVEEVVEQAEAVVEEIVEEPGVQAEFAIDAPPWGEIVLMPASQAPVSKGQLKRYTVLFEHLRSRLHLANNPETVALVTFAEEVAANEAIRPLASLFDLEAGWAVEMWVAPHPPGWALCVQRIWQ